MLKPFFRKHGWKYLPGAILLVICAWLGTRSPKLLGGAIDLVGLGDWPAFAHEVLHLYFVDTHHHAAVARLVRRRLAPEDAGDAGQTRHVDFLQHRHQRG